MKKKKEEAQSQEPAQNFVPLDEPSFTASDSLMNPVSIHQKFINIALRGVGYNPYSALMELVDNSIDAQATEIHIQHDSKLKTLMITDNGIGMDQETIRNSMDFSPEKTYGSNEIGFFGIGMKSAIVNLLKLDSTDNYATIVGFIEDEKASVQWRPFENFSVFNGPVVEPNLDKKTGVTIFLKEVEKIDGPTIKRNFGVVFFHVLNSGKLKIFFNGEEIIATDPLYRESSLSNRNNYEATVQGHKIEIKAIALGTDQERNLWDSGTNPEKEGGRFSFSKSGFYVLYGNRYIETGGICGLKTHHPAMNYTRIEFSIPKELTEVCGVKFNKTSSVDLSKRNKNFDILSDLRKELSMALNWGVSERKKITKTEIPDDEINDLKKLEVALNKAAERARINGPKKKDSVIKPEDEEPKEKKPVDPNNKKLPQKPRIKQHQPFQLKFEGLGKYVPFWIGEKVNGKFILTINTSHVFYTTYWINMNQMAKTVAVTLLGSIAEAQYEKEKDAIDSDNFTAGDEKFWREFWGTVSGILERLLIYTQ